MATLKYKIFLVDDDEILLKALKKSLVNDQYDIDCYRSAEDCIKHMDDNPQVVILDYHLNGNDGKNGIDVLKLIKETAPLTRVIMFSAEKNKEITAEMIKQGAYDYIVKSESAFVQISALVHNITNSLKLRVIADAEMFNYKLAMLIPVLLWLIFYILSIIFKD